MHRVEDTVWELLYGKVTINGNKIPILINSPPTLDYNTCITLETVGSADREERFVERANVELKPTHPLYDNTNPNKKYPVDATYQRRNIALNVHIWSYREEDRHNLIEQVLTLFHQALNYHHIHCKSYDYNTGLCSNLNTDCCALNNVYSRGMKGQCPKPKEYGYTSLLRDSLIIPHTFKVESQRNNDDLTTEPITLHTIIGLELDYYHTFIVGGTPTITNTLMEK